jgi:hypothetical protein
MDNLIQQLTNLYHFSPEDVLALKVILVAFLLMGLAIAWNALRPVDWRKELHATRRANRDGQRIIERLEQVSR